MDSYYLIFTNSLLSSFIFSLRFEVAWFAAQSFGTYDMKLATAAALSGSVLGTGADFAIGYCLSLMRAKWFNFSEASYMRASKFFRRYVILVLFFPWIPFTSLFALAAGIFRVPPFMALVVITLGRVGYYSYYLLQP